MTQLDHCWIPARISAMSVTSIRATIPYTEWSGCTVIYTTIRYNVVDDDDDDLHNGWKTRVSFHSRNQTTTGRPGIRFTHNTYCFVIVQYNVIIGNATLLLQVSADKCGRLRTRVRGYVILSYRGPRRSSCSVVNSSGERKGLIFFFRKSDKSQLY